MVFILSYIITGKMLDRDPAEGERERAVGPLKNQLKAVQQEIVLIEQDVHDLHESKKKIQEDLAKVMAICAAEKSSNKKNC